MCANLTGNCTKGERELLFEVVRIKYGDRLTSDELEEVKKGVDRIFEAVEKLRAVKLENWDEPFSIFRPYRKDE